MGKHFDADQFSFRPCDLLVDDLLVDFVHLFQVQLACQDDDIGKTGIEFQRFRIGDIELRGEMHLLPDTVRIVHGRHISRNDCRDFRLLRRVDNLAHQRQVLAIYNSINGQIAFNTMLTADRNDLAQVVRRKVIGRARTHIQSFNTEINRIGSSLDSRHQRFVRTDRSHYFKIFLVQVLIHLLVRSQR